MKKSNNKKENTRKIESQFDLIANHLVRIERKMDGIEGKMDIGFASVNVKLVEHDYRLSKLETKVDNLEDKLDEVNDNLKGFTKEYNVRVSALEKKSH